jgi:hypothetical protein
LGDFSRGVGVSGGIENDGEIGELDRAALWEEVSRKKNVESRTSKSLTNGWEGMHPNNRMIRVSTTTKTSQIMSYRVTRTNNVDNRP